MKILILLFITFTFVSCIENKVLDTKSKKPLDKPMVSVWRIGNPSYGDGSLSLELPLRSGFQYDITVDWGDGSTSKITSSSAPERIHTYTQAGDFTVKISGNAQAWYYNSSDDSEDNGKLISIQDLGDLGWINLEQAFYYCNNLETFSGGATTNVVNMEAMFRGASSLTSLDITSFDTSKVSEMKRIFRDTTSLESLDISKMNTSLVTDMTEMFYGSGITSLDLSTLDTSNVTNMVAMFYGSSLTSLDLSPLDTSKVTTMALMFKNMPNITSLDLTGLDTSSLLSMYQIFIAAPSLETVNISNIDTSSVVNMYAIFAHNTSLTTVYANGIDLSSVTNSAAFWLNTPSLTSVYCDQVGGNFFGETCI